MFILINIASCSHVVITNQLVIDFNNGQEIDVGYRRTFRKISNDEIYGWTSDTVDDVAEEYSGVEPVLILVGYILMILYCGATFLYFDWVRSHVSVGLVSSNFIMSHILFKFTFMIYHTGYY